MTTTKKYEKMLDFTSFYGERFKMKNMYDAPKNAPSKQTFSILVSI